MDSFNELQQLWQEAAPKPTISAKEIIALVKKQRRKMLLTSLGAILALLLTIPVMVWVFISYQPVYATTRFSIILCLIAIVGGLFMQSTTLLALLMPVKEDVDNKAMITALQKLKMRQRQINTTFISAYFIVLGTGMALYLFEFVRGNILFGICIYALTFGWFAFAWFYLRPRTIKKQNAALDSMINHLQTLQTEWEEQ